MTCQLYLPIQYFSKPLLQSKVQVSNVYRIHAGVMGRHLPTSTITIPSPRHSPPTCHAARLPPLMPLPSHLSCHSPSTCHDTPLPPVTPLLSHLLCHSPPICHATPLPPVTPLPSHLSCHSPPTCSFSRIAFSTSCMLSFTCRMASYSRCSRDVLISKVEWEVRSGRGGEMRVRRRRRRGGEGGVMGGGVGEEEERRRREMRGEVPLNKPCCRGYPH